MLVDRVFYEARLVADGHTDRAIIEHGAFTPGVVGGSEIGRNTFLMYSFVNTLPDRNRGAALLAHIYTYVVLSTPESFI
jgi:hypothetical protein